MKMTMMTQVREGQADRVVEQLLEMMQDPLSVMVMTGMVMVLVMVRR